jgi:hypothetical protein
LTKGEEESLLTKVDEALSGTSSLHTIASNVRQLFFFTPTVQTQQERYTNSISQPGFARDIDRIIRKLNDLRFRRTFSKTDLDKVKELDTKLRSDFFDQDSHLRVVLNSYIMNLEDLVKTVLLEMNPQLKIERFKDVLMPAYGEIEASSKPENSKWPVLGEHHLIRELLKNLFSNLRHSFPDTTRQMLPNDAVRLEFRATRFAPRPEKGEKSAVCLLYQVKGKPAKMEDYTDPEHTITDQLLRLQELGGEWEFVPDENGDSFVFSMSLLTRFGYTPQPGSAQKVEEERQLDDEV